MYQVSEQYIEQMMHRGTRRRLSGTIGTVPFTSNDIVRNSFSITGRATEESDTKIGGVYLGELELTFVPSFLSKVARTEYQNKDVSISIGLLVDPDNNSWVDVPCGVFTLQAPKLSKQGISVHGYDYMQKLDKKFNVDQTSATAYDFLSYIATECHVELGQTQAEIEALPNGLEVLGLYTENDIETHRDMLYWLAQTCGCFACADRQGKIVLRPFGADSGIEYDEEHRDDDIVFSGYTTKWTGVSFVDIATKTTRYYGLPVDDGLTMNMGSNPLLQMGTAEAVERRRRAVLNAIAGIQYTPFYMNSARDPIFDLGDTIPFTGGISGNSTGCIMAYTYTLDNFTFEGYGDDPDLANGRSKTDKNIAGLMQSTVENEVTYFNYANLNSITFGSEVETTIASLRFTAAQVTTVKIMHEFIFDMLSDLTEEQAYQIRYYLDNELLTYQPYEYLGGIEGIETGNNTEFSICRDFFYIIKDVEPNIPHTWQVKIITYGIDETFIDVNHAHVTLEGQRMYAEEGFDGFIEVFDNITVVPLGYLGVVSIGDAAEIGFNSSGKQTIADNVNVQTIKSMELVPISEDPQVIMQSLELKRTTENTTQRVTEDGKRRVTE